MQGNWKNRLEQWAPEPPAGVWERLSEEMETVPQPPLFAQKLQQYSEAPPPNAWQAILAQLDAPAATPVVRLFSKNKLLRYGSVAASVLFAFFLLRQYSGNDNAGSTPKPLQQQTTLPLPGEVGNLGVSHAAETDQTAQRRSATPPANTFAYTSKSTVPHLDKDPMPTLQAERKNTVRIYEVMPAAAPDLNDGYVERYIVIPIAEDAAVRLPKKLYDLFRCGEAPAYAGCTELMLHIRQQSAAPSFAATADFPGLLELVQQSELRQ